MAYDAFTDGKPVGTDTGPNAIDYVRKNEMALRDALVMGSMSGWALTPSGGTNEQPATLTYSKSTERLRLTLTWGTTGGEAGNVTKVLHEYSSNSGGAYTALLPYKNKNLTYNSDGTVASTTWDNT